MEYFEIMKSKKAQISTFIIIGLIILIVVALVIYIISQLTKEEADLFRKELLETPLDALPAREFVQSCVNSIGEEALHLIGSSGGYISVKESYKYIPELNFESNYLIKEFIPTHGAVRMAHNFEHFVEKMEKFI